MVIAQEEPELRVWADLFSRRYLDLSPVQGAI
jgi:hypothetical protein